MADEVWRCGICKIDYPLSVERCQSCIDKWWKIEARVNPEYAKEMLSTEEK